ncbi:MAG: hypothetical protein LBC90_02275 [Candidatus Adiutrix sp.]|jgi:hypothetical protein|nr:hypothetical protein [Candidatus Adiutrix sp.]
MSFLNALASSGLTVSLRFCDHIQRANKSEAVPSADQILPESAGGAEAAALAEAPRASRPAPPPLSPEERAAGRAEAKAQLTAEGALGLLQPGLAFPGEETPEAAPAEGEETGPGQAEGPLKKLSPEEEAQVRQLAQRDQEVKAHEQAHVAASGGLAGSPQYTYQTGPDGRQYAVGGEVSIRRGGSSNTDQALRDAESVKRGATAPARPSSQDLAVAAKAEADIRRLQAKKAQEDQEIVEGQGREEASPAAYGSAGSATLNASPTPEKMPANGDGFGSQAAGAYAAVKLGFQNTVRPLLARA